MSNEQSRKRRNANIELLRILSMLMVTTLHAVGKGELLLPLGGAMPMNGWISWGLEALSISAVNIFMLISGYFMIEAAFKWGRLIELILQTIFYSAGTYVIFYFTGNLNADEKDVYHALFGVLPIHMNLYWFITAYVVIYLLSPLITAGAKALSEKQFRFLILGLVVYECLFKSVLPVALEEDSKGYSVLWFLIVFLIGAYLRLYGFRFLKNTARGWITYLISSALILAESAALGWFHAATGHVKDIQQISFDYNHVLVLGAAIGIFAAFLHAKPMAEGIGKVICTISPYALGVYLFQENMTLRYRWQEWFGLRGSLDTPVAIFLLRCLAAVTIMFAGGIIIDFFRSKIFYLISKNLFREGK